MAEHFTMLFGVSFLVCVYHPHFSVSRRASIPSPFSSGNCDKRESNHNRVRVAGREIRVRASFRQGTRMENSISGMKIHEEKRCEHARTLFSDFTLENFPPCCKSPA